jgi:hypothetical protein
MSYNYEINFNAQKKKYNNSKYTYKYNESDSHTYIFELSLKDKCDNIHIIRRIKKCNQGNLVSADDNIQYNMIEKYKLTIIDANNPDNSFIIKELINHSLTTTTYINNNIYLEIIENSEKLMDFNYHININ